LLVGLLIVLAIDPSVWPLWVGDDIAPLAFPWRMTVASVIAFCVCVAGRPLPSQTKKRR
jgi:hypothetical protein